MRSWFWDYGDGVGWESNMDWLRIGSSAYWGTFTVTFLLVAVWESRAPERDWIIPSGRRWTAHGSLTLIGAVIRTFAIRLSPVAAALAAQGNSWSGLHVSALPLGLGVLFSIVLLDASKFLTHRLFHAVPWLWRIHRVHHSDPDFDVSTGLRFHPLEPFLPVGAELGLILLLSLPVEGVIASQVLTCAINFIGHANADVPKAWERILGWCVVTPHMHRIHHSEQVRDQQTNFGDLLPWWDRGFGTYRAEIGSGQFRVGLRGYQDKRSMELTEMLVQPFRASRDQPHSE